MVALKKPWPALLHLFLQSLAGALGPSEACSMQRKMKKQSHSPTALLLCCEHLLCNGCSKCQFLSWAGFVVFFQRWLPSLGISCLRFLLQMTTSNFPYLVTHKKKLNIKPSCSCSTFQSSCKLGQPLFQILEVVMDSSRATFSHSALSANVMALFLWCLYRRLYRE